MCIKHWILVCNEHFAKLVWVNSQKGKPAQIDFVSEISSSPATGLRKTDFQETDFQGTDFQRTELPDLQQSNYNLSRVFDGKDDEDGVITSEQIEQFRFSKEISVWVEMICEELDISILHIFAPTRFIDILRESFSPKLALRVIEHHASLMNFTAYELRSYWIRDGLI
jgi:Protein required for attachment to host cells